MQREVLTLAYAVRIDPVGEVTVEPGAGYHLNEDYPHHVKLADGSRVELSGGRGRIPPAAKGTVAFSVCNEDHCLIEKVEL